MGQILKRLKKYFKETSEEQIQKDWDATAKYDEGDSPLVSEYVEDLNFQLGYLAGEYVVKTQLPTLSTDMLRTSCTIEVGKELSDIWQEKDENFDNAEGKEHKTKIFYENLKWYRENIEAVYLEDEIQVRIARVDPTDLRQFARGFDVALWESDLSHYIYSEFVPNKGFGGTFIKLKRYKHDVR